MSESYQARTARYKREELERLRDRLHNAVKKDTNLSVWTFELNDELRGAVRTITAMGYKAEIEYNKDTGKMQLIAAKYKVA